MDGATMLEVAAQRNRHAVNAFAEAAEFAVDGVVVQERLAGVFAGAVARVDDRHADALGKLRDRASFRVTHDDSVGIAADNARGVFQRFAFGKRGEGEAGGVADAAAQAREGGVEADAGAGAGFKEQVGHDRAVKGVAAVLTPRDGLEGVCDFEDSFEFAAVELVDGQDVSACKGHGFAPWEFAALYSGLRRDATRQGAQ